MDKGGWREVGWGGRFVLVGEIEGLVGGIDVKVVLGVVRVGDMGVVVWGSDVEGEGGKGVWVFV